METIAYYWKAIIGFTAPAAVVIGSAVTDASGGGSHITQAEWITALVAAVVTSGGVLVKRNGPRPQR